MATWIRLRFWAVTIGLGLIAAAATLIGITWWLIRGQPDWWKATPVSDAHAGSVGQDLENAVVSQLHATRPPAEPWSVSITASDANDWLDSRLVKWLANREPGIDWHATIERSLVDFRDGRIFMGASIRADPVGTGQVISAILTPTIDDKGQLWLIAEDVSIGRLSLPLSLVSGDEDSIAMRFLRGGIAKTRAAHHVADALAGHEPLAIDPFLGLADRRKVRLLSVVAREGRLELTCRTESP